MLLGEKIIRSDITGIMGAFGAALIAKERYKEGHESSLIKAVEWLIRKIYERMMCYAQKIPSECLKHGRGFSSRKL